MASSPHRFRSLQAISRSWIHFEPLEVSPSHGAHRSCHENRHERPHLRDSRRAPHRSQNANAREVALLREGSARLGAGIGNARYLSEARDRGVPIDPSERSAVAAREVL